MAGFLAIALHAHLPFVRHPENGSYLEENWLYEAISEVYVRLLDALGRLSADQIPYRLTLSLSPTLIAMLTDPLLMKRYATRLDALCELTEREVHRTRKQPTHREVALFHRDLFQQVRKSFHDRYSGNLIAAFRALAEAGHLELITTSATHGFLPHLRSVPQAVRAQVTLAANQFRQLFGKDPMGMWLPECGYYEGLESLLAAERVRYFFVDTHGLTRARPRPLYEVYAPVFTAAKVAAFGRDPESADQVWSATGGYPGDPVYREFYRDLGWDAEYDYIRPYLGSDGARTSIGIKYHQITGSSNRKQLYQPALAERRALEHAKDFVLSRERQLGDLSERMGGRPPIVCALYDAELFGHWWFEGPIFLEAVLREGSNIYKLGALSDYLRDNPEHQLVELPMSSWGEGGYGGVWLNPSNDWIYRHLHHCAEGMVELASAFADPDALQQRALNQAARELLLAQSSDWAFMMKAGTTVDYAVRRTQEHVSACLKLLEQVRKEQIDEGFLSSVEATHNIFPEIDYRIYAAMPPKPVSVPSLLACPEPRRGAEEGRGGEPE